MWEATTREWVRGTLRAFAVDPGVENRSRAVGDLELAPFQTRAARRGVDIARRYGGVIIADAVGLGKTRVALAVAETLLRDRRQRSGEARRLWVCVPARLRAQWRRKLRQAGFGDVRIVSHTDLSRGKIETDDVEPGALIVDEAHRFRNPKANRSQRLARLTAVAPAVMATATPVCNSVWDLYHIASFFLAEHDLRSRVGYDLRDAFTRAEAGDFDLTELVERIVIRRTKPPSRGQFGQRPSVKLEMLPYRADDGEAWIWQNLEHELRELSFDACSERWPRELFIEYTLRRWESGPDALLETFEGLVEYHRHWLEAHRHGRSLDREEFRRLFGRETFRQEVFPFLFPESRDEAGGASVGAGAVRADLERLERLAKRVRRVVEKERGSVGAIVELARDVDDKLLVFTRFRRAAAGIFDSLRKELGCDRLALANGKTARATGLGRCSIDEILRRFAPDSYGGEDLAEHQQLRVLVATDCLSEGVNLQDCGRVVLADLPYSALVIEQRIGRLVRPGSPYDAVRVYLPRPKNWTDTLGLRRRLRKKLGHARLSGTEFTSAGPVLGREGEDVREEWTRPDLAQPVGGNGGAAAAVRGAVPRPDATKAPDSDVGPERMGEPVATDEPLAALTKFDALAERLRASEANHPEGFWEAEARVEDDCLWIFALAKRGDSEAGNWLLARPGGDLEYRRSSLIDSLVALADADLPLRRSDRPEELFESAREWLAEREARLRAVSLAPVPLDLETPQHRVWRRICRWQEAGELERGEVELQELRRRLLAPFPRGTVRQLDEVLRAEAPPARTYRRVREVVGRFEQSTGPVEYSVVSGICLRPRGP